MGAHIKVRILWGSPHLLEMRPLAESIPRQEGWCLRKASSKSWLLSLKQQADLPIVDSPRPSAGGGLHPACPVTSLQQQRQQSRPQISGQVDTLPFSQEPRPHSCCWIFSANRSLISFSPACTSAWRAAGKIALVLCFSLLFNVGS